MKITTYYTTHFATQMMSSLDFESSVDVCFYFSYFLLLKKNNSIKYTVLHILNQLHFIKVQINNCFSLDATATTERNLLCMYKSGGVSHM